MDVLIATAIIPQIPKSLATTNTIENFGNTSDTSSNPSQGTSDSSDLKIKDTERPISSEPSTTKDGTTKSSNDNPVNQLVNPTAFSYEVNPERSTVDISKDPNQRINIAVTNSFGQGVGNIEIAGTITDPKGHNTPFFAVKTDSSGKFVLNVQSTIPGKYKVQVIIKSSPSVGGPFKDTVSWDAITGGIPTKITSESKIARQTVDLSDDPRQQILTTVKDSSEKGVKDIPLTITLTNADGISKTFSRITDANGIDEFVTPVDKEGKWSAIINIIGSDGMIIQTNNVAWNTIP